MSFTINAPEFIGTWPGTADFVNGEEGWIGTVGTPYTVTVASGGQFTLELDGNPTVLTKTDVEMNWGPLGPGSPIFQSDTFTDPIGNGYDIQVNYNTSLSPQRFWVVWIQGSTTINTYAFKGSIPPPFQLSDATPGIYTGSISTGALAGSITVTVYPNRVIFSQVGQTPVTFNSTDMIWVLGTGYGDENATKPLTTLYRGYKVILSYLDEISPPGFRVYFLNPSDSTVASLVDITRTSPLPTEGGGGTTTPTPNPAPATANPVVPAPAQTSSRTWIWIIVGIIALVVVVVIVIIIIVFVVRSRRNSTVIVANPPLMTVRR